MGKKRKPKAEAQQFPQTMGQPGKKLQRKEKQLFWKASMLSSSFPLPFLPTSECLLRSLWWQQRSWPGVQARPWSPCRHQWGSLPAYLCIKPKLKILLREETSCQPISLSSEKCCNNKRCDRNFMLSPSTKRTIVPCYFEVMQRCQHRGDLKDPLLQSSLTNKYNMKVAPFAGRVVEKEGKGRARSRNIIFVMDFEHLKICLWRQLSN